MAVSVRAIGAEATVSTTEWMGIDIVEKRRIAKGYRHAELDDRLRDERTRDEGRLLMAARTYGVPTPIVYDIDREAGVIRMQVIPGRSLKQALAQDDDATASDRMALLGQLTARLHEGGLVHGDLTTSNAIVPADDPEGLVIIDFGLGQWSIEDEQRAVDLHLIEEALDATDPRAKELFARFQQAYAADRDADPTFRRLEAVRERGRYRGVDVRHE